MWAAGEKCNSTNTQRTLPPSNLRTMGGESLALYRQGLFVFVGLYRPQGGDDALHFLLVLKIIGSNLSLKLSLLKPV